MCDDGPTDPSTEPQLIIPFLIWLPDFSPIAGSWKQVANFKIDIRGRLVITLFGLFPADFGTIAGPTALGVVDKNFSQKPRQSMIRNPGGWMQIVGRAIWLLAFVILCLGTVWATAALYIDLPATNLSLSAAILYLVVVLTILFFFKFRWVSLGICFALFVGVALWWWSIQPTNNRDWQLEVAEIAWAQIDGDEITIHNLRNFDYEPGLPAKPRWESKSVYLSQLRGVDLFINFWGSTLICHPIVSFQFGASDHVAISVETRMAKGQTYPGWLTQFCSVTGTGKQLWDFADTDFERASVSGPLFVQMRESVAQRSPGDPNHFPERAVHFHK
jgi:hypothetical protein